jgi:hypothetical protein
MAPMLVPAVARRVSTFPMVDGSGLSSTTVWCVVLALCVAVVALSVVARCCHAGCGGSSFPN